MSHYKYIICSVICILVFQTGYCQHTDSNSINILKDAISRLHNLDKTIFIIEYKLLSDTGKNSDLRNSQILQLNYLPNHDKLFVNSNNDATLITKDTVYKYTHAPNPQVQILENYSERELQDFNIESIFDYSYLIRDMDSSQLYTTENEYIVTIYRKNQSYNNGLFKSLGCFDKIWINKSSLLPTKRQNYFKIMDDFNKISIDVREQEIIPENPSFGNRFSIDVFKNYRLRKNDKLPYNELKLKELIGKKAPSFIGTNLYSNKEEKLSDYEGKVVIIDSWFLNCIPCRTLMPKLNAIYSKYNKKGLEVVGINDKDLNHEEIKKYLDQKDLKYTQLLNTGVNKNYFIHTFPTTILIDKKGIIKHIEIGYFDIELAMTKLIEEELSK